MTDACQFCSGGRGRGRGGRDMYHGGRSHGPTWAHEGSEKRPADFDAAGDAKRPRPGEGPPPTNGYGDDRDNHGDVSEDDAKPPRNATNGEPSSDGTRPPPVPPPHGTSGALRENDATRPLPQLGINGDVSQAQIQAHPHGDGTDAGGGDAKPPPPRDGSGSAVAAGGQAAAVQCDSLKVQSAGGTDLGDEGTAANGVLPGGRGVSSRRARTGVRKARGR